LEVKYGLYLTLSILYDFSNLSSLRAGNDTDTSVLLSISGGDVDCIVVVL
jgi:hypothetical protein